MRLHIIGEDCRSIQYPMYAARYFLVIVVHHFGFVMVAVAVEPDGVPTAILGLVVRSSLCSRDGPLGRLFVVSLSVAAGVLLVDR